MLMLVGYHGVTMYEGTARSLVGVGKGKDDQF